MNTYGKSDGMSLLRLGYKKTVTSILCSLFVHLLEGSQLAYLELCHKKVHKAVKWEKLLANSQSKSENLNLIVHEELNPAMNHVNLEVDHHPVEPSGETTALADVLNRALRGTLKQMYLAKPYLDSWLCFVAICYIVIDDKYSIIIMSTFQMTMWKIMHLGRDRDRVHTRAV